MVGLALLALGLAGAPALTQSTQPPVTIGTAMSEPEFRLDRKFALPRADYRAPDGTWKHGNGIIVGREVSPDAMVGIGFFKMKSKSQEGLSAPPQRKSHKVALGLSLRF